MSYYEKLYFKIKNNPKDVMFDELRTLMTKVGGFNDRPGKGDHWIFTHPDFPDIRIVIDTRGGRKPLKPIYVKKCMKYFDEVNPHFKEVKNNE
ncbi:hypothetical protein SAMN05660826_00962 [Caldanaerovirga acetigignens]|uniref:HicA toxin of toxin-antitoxin n=1 Tax=Caldanaerovirga acetigignens TaxID=447595 RepID=A0A1M7IMP4_9FIRM|nr:hypothetical protein [Caldanaerovirga acetigignens]SHM41873.1 hypothetical protein SAMN05660826_00962 [Caldanaerovirga acetigignens]